VLTRKDYSKTKNYLVSHIGDNNLFYREHPSNEYHQLLNGYFYIKDNNSFKHFFQNNKEIIESCFCKFIYHSFFDENFNFIEHEDHKEGKIKFDCISRKRIIYKDGGYLSNLEFINFINFIYQNQKDDELFFSIIPPNFNDNSLNIIFRCQNFEYKRSVHFDIGYDDFEKFINSLIKYRGVEYYKNDEGYHFMLLISKEEDLLNLKKELSDTNISSVFYKENQIYLNYKDKTTNSFFKIFPCLTNNDIKTTIEEIGYYRLIDEYYFISFI